MTTSELRMMDVEIHRKVMREECRFDEATGEWCMTCDWFRNLDGSVIPVSIPKYSTSWHGLGLLTEFLRECWGCYHLTAGLEWHCYASSSNAVPPDGSGETPMLAVCRAALKAAEDYPAFRPKPVLMPPTDDGGRGDE